MKRTLGKYLKEKSHRWRVKNKTTFLSEHTCANPHMHNTGTSLLEREHSVWIWPAMHSATGGWGSDDPTCKTTAAKFTKCLEFKSVSHLSLAQTNQKQPVCTRVEVRSPPATFVPGIVNTVLSFSALSYRSHTSDNYVLQPNHSSRWSSDDR